MSDIRCPMCGKPNPAEAEVCKYCQARLKPLVIQPQTPAPAAQPPQPAPTGGDEVDWLRGLAGDSSPVPAAEEPIENAPLEPAGDQPDWLARIRQKTREEQDAVSPIGRPPKIDASQPAPQDSATPEPPAGLGGSDWLQSLRGESQTGELAPGSLNAPPPAAAAPSIGQDLDNDDWLASFGARLGTSDAGPGQTPPEDKTADQRLSQFAMPPSTSIPKADVPDWLKSFSMGQPLEETPAPPAPNPLSSSPALDESVPDWLRSFSPDQPAASAPPAFESPAGTVESEGLTPEGEPDWLQSFGKPSAESAPQASAEALDETAAALPAEDMPDWLKSFASVVPPAAEPAAPAPAPDEREAAVPAGEMPDWLKSYSPPSPAATTQESAADQPEWLRSFAASQPPAEPPAAVPQEAVPAEEMPDWLKTFAAEQPAAAPQASQPASQAVEPESEPEGQPAEGVPDWLKSFAAPEPAAEIPAVPQAEAAVEVPALEPTSPEGIPDWLKNFTSSVPVLPDIPASPETSASSVFLLPESSSAPAEPQPAAVPAEEIPDWLKTYSEKEDQPAPEQAPEPAAAPVYTSPFSDVELPQWMAFDQAAPTEQAAPETIPGSLIDRPEKELAGPAGSFAGEDMTHWLDHSREEQAAQDEAGLEAGAENIETAQLPAWLQAMRPVESAMPSGEETVNEQRVEKSGPLAGLRGVVRGEDLVTQYQKPPAYSVKLRVTEPQTLHAAMLEGLISDETKPQEIPADSIIAPQMVVRVATGLALIALILIVILFGPRPVAPLALTQPGQQIFNAINGLNPGAPVLVAVEYQGGLSAELRIAAQPVLQHAMAHNARLVFISTQPEGPVLAESLFSAARSGSAANYPPTLKANLGYLLGGSTALKTLTVRPLNESLPQLWGPGASWSQPALAGLKQITDFSQVILLTDTPEAARDWIEQVQPVLAASKIPLLVISSAQAAPMLQPYQTSGQISGLLSGLTGGAAYEQIIQQPGRGTVYWNAYLAGILAVILFILLGGIVSLFSNISSPKTKPKA